MGKPPIRYIRSFFFSLSRFFLSLPLLLSLFLLFSLSIFAISDHVPSLPSLSYLCDSIPWPSSLTALTALPVTPYPTRHLVGSKEANIIQIKPNKTDKHLPFLPFLKMVLSRERHSFTPPPQKKILPFQDATPALSIERSVPIWI